MWISCDQRRGLRAHLLCQEDLSTRWRDQRISQRSRALVSDSEVANLINGVAKEFQAHWMFFSRWEDIDDAASYSELTTSFHEVSAGVGVIH